jgi:IS30 family transposase
MDQFAITLCLSGIQRLLIAARLRHMYPDDPQWHISHETLYAAIYTHPRGALKQGMVDALRQSKPQRGRRRTTAVGASFVPEALRIVHRPEEIATRLLPGHWEGDFIKGAFNRSAVGTLVERKTRFVVLCKMEGCTAQAALEGFTRQMKKLPAFLRESLTYDRGSEMACHAELSTRLNLDIWFADTEQKHIASLGWSDGSVRHHALLVWHTAPAPRHPERIACASND